MLMDSICRHFEDIWKVFANSFIKVFKYINIFAKVLKNASMHSVFSIQIHLQKVFIIQYLNTLEACIYYSNTKCIWCATLQACRTHFQREDTLQFIERL